MNNLLVMTLFLVNSFAYAQWDLNDVSYLLPLPSSMQQDTLLRMTTQTSSGPLLNPDFASQIPPLTLPMRDHELVASLRVVAIRIDPCFPLPTPQNCQRQIRLVWQPLGLDRRQVVTTADAALHSFFRLSNEEFISLLTDIATWKRRYQFSTRGQPLTLHPAWQRPGALLDFQRIILRYVGPRNFTRVTAMFLRGAGNMWAFVSYELRNGKLTPQPIARLNGKTSQTFVNLAMPTQSFQGQGMVPKPDTDDTFDQLLHLPAQATVGTEEIIRQSFRSIYRTENPKIFNPENMDCVSCHITQPVKHFYFSKRPDLKLDQMWGQSQYLNSRYNLKNLSPDRHDTQIIRAFGYFGNKPVISQRVINESADVADFLNRNQRPSNQ